MARQIITPSDTDPAGWGVVPSLGGDAATADPGTGSTTPSLVQDAQSATASTQSVAQSVVLPPAPIQAPMLSPEGYMTPAWVTWFQSLQRRVGGYVATPSEDAQVLAYEPQWVDQTARSTAESSQWDTPSPRYTQVDSDPWDPGPGGQWVNQLNPVLPKTSGKGLKVDLLAPTFPWRDLEGALNFQSVVPGSLNIYRTPIRQYAFSVNDELEVRFHIPHDYVPGTDLYAHVHWSHIGTAITGTFTGTFQHTYAKGHNQAAFPAAKTVTVSYATVNIATTPQYQHRIDEVQLSTTGGSATLMDSSVVEPDGLLLLNYVQTAIPTITGTITEPFIHYVDLHYQSTGMGTKQKAPSFYV